MLVLKSNEFKQNNIRNDSCSLISWKKAYNLYASTLWVILTASKITINYNFFCLCDIKLEIHDFTTVEYYCKVFVWLISQEFVICINVLQLANVYTI